MIASADTTEGKRPGLTERWYPLRFHSEQSRLWSDDARFRVAVAGRRSGKTELAKRWVVIQAVTHHERSDWLDGLYVLAAPTHQQAKDLYWADLKAMIPPRFVLKVSESELTVTLVNGTRVRVVGLDRPQRIEGQPIDGIVLDEYAEMRPETWARHIRPALSTPGRPGWAWFIGVPRGAPHFRELFDEASRRSGWGAYHWTSDGIVPAEEIEEARRTLDAVEFEAEYLATFASYTGRAYYAFDRPVHARRVSYMPGRPLVFAFDFNVSPGVAVVAQEQPCSLGGVYADVVTAGIGEVWIPRNSTTPAVCRRLIRDWGEKHEGEVRIYGDATGGARGSAKVSGSDWDLIRAEFRAIRAWDISYHVKGHNPPERVRVNSVNARLRTADGRVHMLIDPDAARHVIADLEGVVLLEGGSGEIDKRHSPALTHISDALGYYIESEHPIRGVPAESEAIF